VGPSGDADANPGRRFCSEAAGKGGGLKRGNGRADELTSSLSTCSSQSKNRLRAP
jgi:hypothetical protein